MFDYKLILQNKELPSNFTYETGPVMFKDDSQLQVQFNFSDLTYISSDTKPDILEIKINEEALNLFISEKT